MATPPRKRSNDSVRTREYLTPEEVASIAKAAGKVGRHRHRDQHMILMAYRHGFRVSELVALQRSQLHLDAGEMHVRRKKHGKPSTHPIIGSEIRALRKILRDYPSSNYVFVSERGGPLTPSAVFKLIARAAELAGLGTLEVHPHMFRHACGYYLAAKGLDTRAIQDYLGHKNIQHTVRYTELAPNRFKGFFED